MRRRDFIAILCGAAVAWPSASHAQHEMHKIGILIAANAEPFLSTFKNFMRELGYVEGQNVAFEVRSAGGNAELLSKLAAELVNLQTEVIVTVYTPAAIAAKQATAQIPIVMAQAGDPVGTGLVASLARPGGNVTGLSATAVDLGAKLLEVMRDVIPSVARVGVLANAQEHDPFTKLFVQQIEMGSEELGISASPFMTHGAKDFAAAFSAMKEVPVDAVVVQASLLLKPAIDLAQEYRLPTISVIKSLPVQGGLMSYGPHFPDLWRRAAKMVDKILHGANPTDMPVEQPTKYEMVINLKAAKTLGVQVPAIILSRADEVIE